MLVMALLALCAFLPVVSTVTVSTRYGKIEGFTSRYSNISARFNSVNKFLGVPFASPPVGKLRLKPPQPPKEWKPRVRQAKEHGALCMQGKGLEFLTKLFAKNFSYSEDCLYLDIYTPNVTLNLPVMVWIHGGGYDSGTSVTFPGDILSLQGVVVVVIQYRLGAFGFFTTGDSAALGNFGMLDQVEALTWVKENIENFGGDPGKITLFGESAGGLSVSLHLLSPLSKDLFHGVIAESGVDLAPFAIQQISIGVRNSKEVAEKMKCPSSDHKAIVGCLQEKKAADIQKASDAVNFRFVDQPKWAPVVDKHFLHDTPRNLRKKKDFKIAPMMITFNSDEAAGTLGLMATLSFGLTESVDNGVSPTFFKTFLTKLASARIKEAKTADLITDALEFMYTPWPDSSNVYALRSQLVNVLSDLMFFAPSHEVAAIQSQVSPVYMFEFAHRSKVSFGSEWMGVVHANNIMYDFGVPLLPSSPFNYDAADRNVSLFIMALYANFARTGDPTPQPVSGVTLGKFNSSHRTYLKVQVSPKMAASFYPRRMSFWNDYYPKLEQVKFDDKKRHASGASVGVSLGLFVVIIPVLINYPVL